MAVERLHYRGYSDAMLARDLCLRQHDQLIDKGGRYTASGLGDGGRFPNPFLRDVVWGVAQSLPEPGNRSLYPTIVPPFVATMDAFIEKVRPLVLMDLVSGRMPYLPPHEFHDKYTPQKKARKLAKKGWGVSNQDASGNWDVVLYEADDAPAMMAIGAELAINGLKDSKNGDKAALEKLDSWWPVLEQVALYDIFYADREGDGLIKTYYHSENKLINRTWRDSPDAFRKGSRRPKGPLAYFANNVFSAKGCDAMANLAELRGEVGFVETFRKLRDKKIELLHERFWWEEENCFVPVLDGEGKQVKIVTNESIVGLFTKTLYTNEAIKAGRRMLESDLLNSIGTRTRSINDPNFRLEGKPGYHCGPDFGHMDSSLEKGFRNYFLDSEAKLMRERVINYALEYELNEAMSVYQDGSIDYYRRRGRVVTSSPQFWFLHGILGVTAKEVEGLPEAA